MTIPAATIAPRRGSLHRLLSFAKTCINSQELSWLPPWPGPRDPRMRAVRSVRAAALRLVRTQARDAASAPILAFRSLVWPAVLPIKAWRSARDAGLPGFWPRFGQGCNDLALHNLRPDALRALRALRPGDMQVPRLYVADRENQAILIHLHRNAPNARLGDKIAFDTFCRQHRLAHIPILAHGVGPRLSAASTGWPAGSLFVKSANLWGGQGAEPLFHDPAAHAWRDRHGRAVTPATLASWAADTYGGHAWLLQPMLRVDPTWSDWSPGPLGTARIVTVIVRPGDAPEIVAASMRLPRTGMIVDNFSAGALSAEIDWRSGRLDTALGHGGARRWHDHHPDTGAPITGAIVPAWPAVCALACAAHAAAPDLVSVGWDISCHRGAPVLLEANPVFNLAPTVVLGETRWLDAILHRFSALQPPAAPTPSRRL